MDVLLSIVALLLLAAPAGMAAAWFTNCGPDALSSLFRPDRGLGWPHGVQEEDPPPWNWQPDRPARLDPSGTSASRADVPAALAVERVAFRIGRGSARNAAHARRDS
jgi:hypothetical protein